MGNFYGVSSQDLRRIIEMLRPTKTDLLLHRVGGFYDGGYILPKCIKPDVIISPGVSNSSTFEEYYADRGAICYLFDYSVDSPAILHKNFKFTKKFWGLHEDEEHLDCSIWLRKKLKQDQFNILQMDIEGAEYKLLSNSLFKEEIQKFDILVIEFHEFENFIASKNFSKLETIFNDLGKNFNIIHFHQNNNYINFKYKGLAIISDFEITMINKNSENIRYNILGKGDFSLTELDRPNVPKLKHLFPNW